MEWDDLKHFLAVARSGSLTEAARNLKTSAATVSRRIASLERELATRLFEHRQTGYQLTESGEAIRIKAEAVEEAVLAVERQAIGRDLHASGKVRVATTEDLAAFVIAPHLAEFRRDYPDISLEIVTRLDYASLTRRDADIAFRAVRPQQGDLIVRRVGVVDFGLYAARSYAERRGLEPGLSNLSEMEIVTWTEEWAHLRGGPWFAQHAPGATVALAANSTRVHQAACKAGIGVAILACIAADPDPDLVCLLPPERVLSVEIWSVVHRDLSRTARIRAVMDFLAELGPTMGRQAVTVSDPAGRSGSTYPSACRPSSAPRRRTGRPAR
jgi:DNA-binding transcriptional LysR family regulator